MTNQFNFAERTFVGDWQYIDEGSDPAGYPGWAIVGDYWNGWEAPYFEKAVAEQILRENNDALGDQWKYVEDGDKFVIYDGWEEPDIITGIDIVLPDGSMKHVYGIGRYSWTWLSKTQAAS